MGCRGSWTSSLHLLARDIFLKFLECLCKNFSDINRIIYENKFNFRLILTILIFLFAIPKLATQFLHSLKFLAHLISAVHLWLILYNILTFHGHYEIIVSTTNWLQIKTTECKLLQNKKQR